MDIRLIEICILLIVVANTTAQVQRRPTNNRNASPNRVENEIRKQRLIAEGNFRKSDIQGRSIDSSNEQRGRDLDHNLPHLASHIDQHPKGGYPEIENSPLIRFLWKQFMRYLGSTSTDPKVVTAAEKQGKYQERIPDSEPFPCNVSNARSAVRPDRADRVRPGDIDVLAALGDSITAGSGVASSEYLHVFQQNRGLTSFIGGQGTWRRYLTLPNIIKEFNPNVTGYSTGDTMNNVNHHHQQLSISEAGALISDLPEMVRILHKKMLKHTKIDMESDWKMVSIFIGSVDWCLDLCSWKRPRDALFVDRRSFTEALDYLMLNFPRTIILFYINIDIPKLLRSINPEEPCKFRMENTCPCIFAKPFQSIQKDYVQLIDELLEVQRSVASDPKYSSKPDFKVSVQSVLRDVYKYVPKVRSPSGKIISDLRYTSNDCFHLSQRGNALLTKVMWHSLWSNATEFHMDEKMLCPSESSPYFKL